MIRGMGPGFAGVAAPTYPGGVSSGLVLWLDANDTATVTSSAGAVSAWADKSSGGRTFTQSTGAQKPTVDTTTFSGLSALSFNTDKNLVASSPLTLPATFSAFMVVYYPASTGGTRSTVILNTASASSVQNGCDFFGLFSTTAGGYQEIGAKQSSGGTVISVYNSANLLGASKAQMSVIADGVSANLLLRRAGANLSKDAASNSFTVGQTWNQIGESVGGLYVSQGVFAEIVAYNRTLNSTEYAAVESYLKTKWGTP